MTVGCRIDARWKYPCVRKSVDSRQCCLAKRRCNCPVGIDVTESGEAESQFNVRTEPKSRRLFAGPGSFLPAKLLPLRREPIRLSPKSQGERRMIGESKPRYSQAHGNNHRNVSGGDQSGISQLVKACSDDRLRRPISAFKEELLANRFCTVFARRYR